MGTVHCGLEDEATKLKMVTGDVFCASARRRS